MSKEAKLVFDITSLPTGLSPADFVRMYDQHGLVFWDSEKNGIKPKLFTGPDPSKGEETIIVDTKGKELDLETFNKEFVDHEKWDKELHYCLNSAVYYWNNYGSPAYPVTRDSEAAFLKSLNLSDLSDVKDSDDAAKLWEAQKGKVKEALKHVNKEHLQERAVVMEAMKGAYYEEVTKIEKVLADKVKLHDKNGDKLIEIEAIQNIVGKIKTVSPIPEEYSKYRNRKMKWDHHMLIATDYAVLLNIAYKLL